MRYTRLYLDAVLVPDTTLELDERAAHHVARVLRMKSGDEVRLFDGRGSEVLARLETVERKRVTATIQSPLDNDRESPLPLLLGQGISKGERMDFTLQKSVELGVTAIVPLWTQHSQVQLDVERLAKRMQHWHGVIISACEQCGRSTLPLLHPPMKVADWIRERTSADLGLLLDPEQAGRLPQLQRPAGAVRLLVGPEGGLNEDEMRTAREAGFTGIGLGPRVLRTETAALAALAALQLLWGDYR